MCLKVMLPQSEMDEFMRRLEALDCKTRIDLDSLRPEAKRVHEYRVCIDWYHGKTWTEIKWPTEKVSFDAVLDYNQFLPPEAFPIVTMALFGAMQSGEAEHHLWVHEMLFRPKLSAADHVLYDKMLEGSASFKETWKHLTSPRRDDNAPDQEVNHLIVGQYWPPELVEILTDYLIAVDAPDKDITEFQEVCRSE